MSVIWKDIPGFEGVYKVSNDGRVVGYKTEYRCGNNGQTKRVLEERFIVGEVRNGYKRVTLWQNKKHRRVFVHRLVAEAFIPNPDNKPEIDHIDGNPSNNRAENLRWVTHTENLNNPITLKRKSLSAMGNHMLGKKGSLHHNSKKVLCIETNTIYGGVAEAMRKTGAKSISDCCCGRRKTTGGFHWKFI